MLAGLRVVRTGSVLREREGVLDVVRPLGHGLAGRALRLGSVGGPVGSGLMLVVHGEILTHFDFGAAVRASRAEVVVPCRRERA